MIDILKLIPFGHSNPVSRDYLARAYMEAYKITYSAADRKARKDIQDAVEAGELIANVGDGYFRYKDAFDIPYFKQYFRREDKKSWSGLNKNRKAKRKLAIYEKQFVDPLYREESFEQMDITDYFAAQDETG